MDFYRHLPERRFLSAAFGGFLGLLVGVWLNKFNHGMVMRKFFKIIAKLFLVLSTLGLSSCTDFYTYPVGTRTATIRFFDGGSAEIYDEGPCRPAKPIKVDQQTVVDIPIPSEERIYFTQGPMGIAYICQIRYSFIPREGELYISQYMLRNGVCDVRLRRAIVGKEKSELVGEPSLRDEKDNICRK